MAAFQRASLDLVPEIVKKLEHDKTAIVACQMLEMYVLCSKSVPETDIRLFTPGGVVDSYGTFLLIVPEHRGTILFHTTDPDLDTFKLRFLAVKDLDDLDWIGGPSVGPITDKFNDVIEEVMVELGAVYAPTTLPKSSENLSISIEEALNLTVDIPKGLILRPIREDEAKIVDDRWPRKVSNSLKYIEAVIRSRGGIVLCKKNSGEWLSWCLYSFVGGVGMFQTAKEHRGKGYGEIVAKMMTKQVAENGNVPQVQVADGLDVSKRLFQRIGYKFSYRVHWHWLVKSKIG